METTDRSERKWSAGDGVITTESHGRDDGQRERAPPEKVWVGDVSVNYYSESQVTCGDNKKNASLCVFTILTAIISVLLFLQLTVVQIISTCFPKSRVFYTETEQAKLVIACFVLNNLQTRRVTAFKTILFSVNIRPTGAWEMASDIFLYESVCCCVHKALRARAVHET